MSSLKILLPLLAAPLCSSFSPVLHPSISHASTLQPLRATSVDDHTNDGKLSNNDALERMGKVAGSALFALTLSFSAINAPVPFSDIASVPSANAASNLPSITLARRTDDEIVLRALAADTRGVEKEEKIDKKKAQVEKSRETFFEYEARQAEQQEARIEAREKAEEVEFEKDKAEAERLQKLEQRVEKDAAAATSKEERMADEKIAKAILKKERVLERREKKAAKLEKVFLAEEEQEQKILQRKEDAAIAEEKKYEAVEKEYEDESKLAREEELELSKLRKGLSSKKK